MPPRAASWRNAGCDCYAPRRAIIAGQRRNSASAVSPAKRGRASSALIHTASAEAKAKLGNDSALREIGEQRVARRVRDGMNARSVGRVVHSYRQRGACFERRNHRRRELEAQKMHRRGLLVALAFEVLVGDRMNAWLPLDLHPDPVFDPLELG